MMHRYTKKEWLCWKEPYAFYIHAPILEYNARIALSGPLNRYDNSMITTSKWYQIISFLVHAQPRNTLPGVYFNFIASISRCYNVVLLLGIHRIDFELLKYGGTKIGRMRAYKDLFKAYGMLVWSHARYPTVGRQRLCRWASKGRKTRGREWLLMTSDLVRQEYPSIFFSPILMYRETTST